MGFWDTLRNWRRFPGLPLPNTPESSLGEQIGPVANFLHESFIENPAFVKAGEAMEAESAIRDPGRPLELADLPDLPLTAPLMLSRAGRGFVRGGREQAAAEVVKALTPGDIATVGAMIAPRMALKAGITKGVPALARAAEGLNALGDVTAIGAGASDVVSGIAERDPLRTAGGALLGTLGVAGRVGGREARPARGLEDIQAETDPKSLGIIKPTRAPRGFHAGGAAKYLQTSKSWPTFSKWLVDTHEAAKKAILGLPQEVLSPSGAPFSGPASRLDQGVLKGVEVGSQHRGIARGYQNISIMPTTIVKEMFEDIATHPSYAELAQNPQRLIEDFLRRNVWTLTHETLHTAGMRHPVRDYGGYNYDFERYRPGKLNDPNALIPGQDADFDEALRRAFRSYKQGDYDHLVENARPNAGQWLSDFKRALEIERGPAAIPRPPATAVPTGAQQAPVGAQVGPGGRIPTGGLPGGARPGGRGPQIGGGDPALIARVKELKAQGYKLEDISDIIQGKLTVLPKGAVPSPPSVPPPSVPPTGGAGTPPPVVPPTPPPPPEPPRRKINYKKLPGHTIQEMIRRRKAAPIHAQATRYNFRDLLTENMDWVKRYEEQGPQSVPRGEEVKRLMDFFASEEKRYGIPLKERANYLYHIWEEDEETVRRAFRRLGIRPAFTQPRMYESYAKGIEAGLTPKYSNPADIIAERTRQHKKLLGDVGLYNTLRAHRLIKPEGMQPRDWVQIRNFPFRRFTVGKLKHVEPWYAPPEIANRLNRYLDNPMTSPTPNFLQQTRQLFIDIKNVVMSAGVPGTKFNAHGFNTAFRDAGVRNTGEFVTRMAKMPFKLMSTGKRDALWLNDHLDDMARMTEAGAGFNLEDHQIKDLKDFEPKVITEGAFWKDLRQQVREAGESRPNVIAKEYAKLRKVHEVLFEDPLFQRGLVADKLRFMLAEEERLVKGGVPVSEAMKAAAENGNNFYGGIEWEGRYANWRSDPTFRTFLQLAVNAPDWAETQLRVAKGGLDWLRNPRDPKFKAYKNLIQNTALFYIAANAVSRAFGEGEHPKERHFQVRAGKAASGRTRFLKPAGTGADFARLPYDIITKLAEGDLSGASNVVRARMHPMFQGVINAVTNRNYWGRPLTGKEIPVLTQVGRLAHEVTDVAAPSYVKAPVAALAGEAGLEETLMKSVEAPVAYARPELGNVGPLRRRKRSQRPRKRR